MSALCHIDCSCSYFVSSKMQKLVKAAREGTKDGLEKTKAAVKKGRSFIKTKSFCNGGWYPRNAVAAFGNISFFPFLSAWWHMDIETQNCSFLCAERKSTCFEDEESELFIEVDCFNVESVLSPAPEGLSQQQVLDQSASMRHVHPLSLSL